MEGRVRSGSRRNFPEVARHRVDTCREGKVAVHERARLEHRELPEVVGHVGGGGALKSWSLALMS